MDTYLIPYKNALKAALNLQHRLGAIPISGVKFEPSKNMIHIDCITYGVHANTHIIRMINTILASDISI